mmetsp:Transcript_10875/g.24398  ORF Transcript_10875/g.24398 Transcript_10875/m.24398 type:complete len:200 (-) Transcript_10875:481-1080(-)
MPMPEVVCIIGFSPRDLQKKACPGTAYDLLEPEGRPRGGARRTSYRSFSTELLMASRRFFVARTMRLFSFSRTSILTALAPPLRFEQPMTNSPISISPLPSTSRRLKSPAASLSSKPSSKRMASTAGSSRALSSSEKASFPELSKSSSAKRSVSRAMQFVSCFCSLTANVSLCFWASSIESFTKMPVIIFKIIRTITIT